MANMIQYIEERFITLGILFFKSILFFLNDSYQALFISFLHYAIFIIGLYYFIYHSKSKSLYRLLFFGFVLFSALCYLMFNKCILTHIELGICDKKNGVQKTIDTFFGSQLEGNVSSKVVLYGMTIIVGLFLLHDYEIINISTIRNVEYEET